MNIYHDIFFTECLFNRLFQRLCTCYSWFSRLVNRKVQVNWELNTLCLKGFLSLIKFSLSLISVEDTILTVFKVDTWPLITIWSHLFSYQITEWLVTSINKIRFYKNVTNSKGCTFFTIKLCWISCTVNSKVNWLTEIFVKKSFLSWIFLSISLLRCMIVRLTVNINTNPTNICRWLCIEDIIFILFFYRIKVWACWI